MNDNHKEEVWLKLCQHAAVERDSEKFLILIREIERLLGERQEARACTLDRPLAGSLLLAGSSAIIPKDQLFPQVGWPAERPRAAAAIDAVSILNHLGAPKNGNHTESQS